MSQELSLMNSKILIVDDEPLNLELLSQVLKVTGFKNISQTNDPRKVNQLYRGKTRLYNFRYINARIRWV
jgi:CheY-like chemotaxis protein